MPAPLADPLPRTLLAAGDAPPDEAPPLIAGRYLDLPGRGRTFVRVHDGPAGAPTLLLLHGLSASADLNWWQAYATLGEHFSLVAIDHRGHGRGIRSRRPFSLADCADDAVAALDVLGVGTHENDRVIAVGYSMGGPIAQLIWRRHPDRVDGMVLCATSRDFRGLPRERLLYGTMPAVALFARAVPWSFIGRIGAWAVESRLASQPHGEWYLREWRRGDPAKVLQAAQALGRFSSREWIGDVDVPVAVVATSLDTTVPTRRQVKLAMAIPTATIHVCDGDHLVMGRDPECFVAALDEACRLVARRMEGYRADRRHLAAA